MIEVVVGVIG